MDEADGWMDEWMDGWMDAWMCIQGTKLPFHHIPKMLYWVEIW